MSDSNAQDSREESPQEPDSAAIARLQSTVYRLRIGLIVTALVTFSMAGLFVLAVLTVFGSAVSFGESETIAPEKIAETRAELQQAFGPRLARLEVRAIEIEYKEDAPFPFSMASTPNDESLYVEYSLQGSDVLVADLLDVYEDLQTSDLVPTRGTLADRMTPEQFERLLVAYGARTKSPCGAISRYDVRLDEAGSLTEVVAVGGGTYPTKELWSVVEGRVITGDTVPLDPEEDSDREAFIFREDPTTRQFTFLGTEPAETPYDD